MSITEIDNFVKKFYQLWNAGHTAHLDVDTQAGQAWVGLHVQLGHAPGPLHHQPHPPFFQVQKKVASPSRQRRRARRAAARMKTAEEAQNNNETSQETAIEEIANLSNVEIESVNVEETDNVETNARPVDNTAAEAKDATGGKAAEEAVETNTCELCEKTFTTLKGLRAHNGSQHKAIPQVDGCNDVINEPTYCKVCKECPDEIETSEDINFHVMNDHDVKSVIDNYGQEWASARKYCIR